MRALILAFAAGIALTTSAQTAPLAPEPDVIEHSTAMPFELAAQDCGWGWHRTRRHNQWGNPYWGECVPDRGPYHGWGAGSYYPYPGWRVAPPRLGWGYP
jgi:hypothetical protein